MSASSTTEVLLKGILDALKSIGDDLKEVKKNQEESNEQQEKMSKDLEDAKDALNSLNFGQGEISVDLSQLRDAHYDESDYSYATHSYLNSTKFNEDIRDTLHQIRDNQSSSKPKSSADSDKTD